MAIIAVYNVLHIICVFWLLLKQRWRLLMLKVTHCKNMEQWFLDGTTFSRQHVKNKTEETKYVEVLFLPVQICSNDQRRFKRKLSVREQKKSFANKAILPLPTLTLRAGFNSCMNKIFLILQWWSVFPDAQMSKLSPFNVMTGCLYLVSNSWRIIIFCNGLEMFSFSVIESSFGFSNVKSSQFVYN